MATADQMLAQLYADDEQMAWRQAKTNTDFKGDFAWFDQEYPATPMTRTPCMVSTHLLGRYG